MGEVLLDDRLGSQRTYEHSHLRISYRRALRPQLFYFPESLDWLPRLKLAVVLEADLVLGLVHIRLINYLNFVH